MNRLETLYRMKRDIEDLIEIEHDDGEENPTVARSDKRLALVVGHTQRSPGAYSKTLGKSEYFWNKDLANRIQTHAGVEVGIFFRDGIGISGAYKAVKKWSAHAVIELHFNAATPQANGTETLVASNKVARSRSMGLAMVVHTAMLEALGLRNRRVKQPYNGRGEQSLTSVPIPSILIEPFFGSNAFDSRTAEANKEKLAEAIAEAASKYLMEN